ncbi:hypothetical protein Tco_1082673 [Tanacetum coccineum]|uniref:Uncharacterized protein n=1 Tax=Tanacetum coccineum TaxID=301880 RepID=A0ABQ5I141_9ASTR
MSSIVVMTVMSQGIVVVVIVMENIVVVYFFDLGNFESQIVFGVDDTQVVVDKLDRVSFAFHTEDTVARKNLIFCDDEILSSLVCMLYPCIYVCCSSSTSVWTSLLNLYLSVALRLSQSKLSVVVCLNLLYYSVCLLNLNLSAAAAV